MSDRNYRLGDVCHISTGQSAPQDAGAFGSTGHPFVRAGSLERLVNGGSEQALELVAPEKATQYRLRLFPAGTIVFAKSGMSAKLGRVHMLSTSCYVVSHLATVEPSSAVHGRWLLHWFRKNSPTSLIANDAYPSIRTSEIEALEVALPELREQQRIAAILDKVDSLRRKRQEAIRLADDFLSAMFIEMFGAPGYASQSLPTQPLGAVCRFYAGNGLPEGEPFAGQLDGVLHIKVGDMNLPGNELVVSTSREWSTNGAGGIIAPQGAILIPKRGGAIATNKKRVLGRPCALDPNLMAISPGPDLRQDLLFQWFKLFDLSTITSGSAVPQLNKGDLAPLRIVVPPLDQQDRFVAMAQRVASIINRQGIQLGDIESACRALTDELLAA